MELVKHMNIIFQVAVLFLGTVVAVDNVRGRSIGRHSEENVKHFHLEEGHIKWGIFMEFISDILRYLAINAVMGSFVFGLLPICRRDILLLQPLHQVMAIFH